MSRPNILILMADQFRSDLIGANGSAICRTPYLDKLAAGGVTFTRAYCTTPLCTPARGALFTGRYPHSNGLTANTQYPDTPTPRLREGERLLFEHLAAAGYHCGYVGKWHLSVGDEAAEARRRGVADFLNARQAAALHRERLGLALRDDLGKSRARTMEGPHPPMSGVAPYPAEYATDAGVAGQAIELLRHYREQRLGTSERPFAIICSFPGPHFPIEPPEPYASLYRPEDVPMLASFEDTFEGKPQGQRSHPWLQLAAHLSWPEWQRVIAHYWGFATFVDALMGRVLDVLDETRLAERTIVMATADHGEMAGHHRMFDKGPYFYDDVMRVPFVWRRPGFIDARDGPNEALVRHVDVVPTVLELAGIEPVPGSPPPQGRSLLPEFSAGVGGVRARHASPVQDAAAEEAVFGETNVGDKPNPQVNARMIVMNGWKYVYRPDDVDELYFLYLDTDELRNEANNMLYRPILDVMRDRLARWMRETGDVLRIGEYT